jgi:hypothetical protein
MTRAVLCLALASAPLLVACGKSGPFASCDTRTTTGDHAGLCRAWSGEQTATTEQFQNLCTQQIGGTFTAGKDCPATDRVGSCYTDQLFGLFLTYVYYAPTFDAQSAEQACLARTECTQSSCEWRPNN